MNEKVVPEAYSSEELFETHFSGKWSLDPSPIEEYILVGSIPTLREKENVKTRDYKQLSEVYNNSRFYPVFDLSGERRVTRSLLSVAQGTVLCT